MIGLVLLLGFSSVYGENNGFTSEFVFSYLPEGIISPFTESPGGFKRAYEQPNYPLSRNFPDFFKDIQLIEETSRDGGMLKVYETIGDEILGTPTYYSFKDYYRQRVSYKFSSLWKQNVAMTDSTFFIEDSRGGSTGSLEIIGADIAGQKVSLRIRGLITITGKYNQQNNAIVATGNMQSEQKNFLMDQTQQFTIEGKIGDRITVSIDEDSQSDFEFENNISIDYQGKEDEIVQSAHFGNIGLSLPGTKFVTGSSSSGGLFGGKASMKLGPIDVTAIASYEKKESNKQSWGGGTGESGSSVKIFDYEYKRNTYFFVDKFFREEMYPYDPQTGNFSYSDMIEDFELYVSCLETEDNKQKAVAFVDLASDGSDRVLQENSEDVPDSIYFRKLTKPTSSQSGEYELNVYQGYIRLNVGINDDKVLAIAYRTNQGKEYGDLLRGKHLKIIKPENPKPTYKTWDLEMKNVYDLKARNINSDGFELKIFYNGSNEPKEYLDGTPYIRYFGLDNFDQNGSPGHDGRTDTKPQGLVVDLDRGELWFPYVLPFQKGIESADADGIYNDSLRASGDDQLPDASEIYSRPVNDPERMVRKYYIEVSYTNQSSTIDLGEMFIIEGSEELYVNGKRMTSGIDYDIDYFSGMITLKSAQALDPNASIEVNYETEQLFGGIGETKMMAGARAEYQINEKNFIGATAMYYDRSVLDDKNVNIGDEPYRNFIWDVNGEFEYDLNWLNRAINALPFVYMKQSSYAKISTEIAQIVPNPNTVENVESGDVDGVAKLDDFESSNQETPMNINFQDWSPASKPENTFFHASFPERGFMFWYNPFYVDSKGTQTFGIYTKNIWPEKDITETNQYTSVLTMVLDPEINGFTGRPSQNDTRQIWGGIMQPVYAYDQSNSKYIEVWAKGDKGQLQIDIGEISEDYYNVNYDQANPSTEFGDGQKNYEDQNDNTVLDIYEGSSEDVGINGLTDDQEEMLGWDPMIDNFDKEGYKNGEVRFCNGTEGNAGTDGIQPYPETEDIDGDGKLDQSNNYYSYSLNFDREEWKVSETFFKDGTPTGWKQYQIPLTAVVDSVGLPSFMSIRTMRLNMMGVEDQDTISIASIAIVGNEWQEMGVKDEMSEIYRLNDDKFFITVKNSDENSDYRSPPGITGREQINPISGSTIIEKEQSLVLNIENLLPGETGMAQKIMLEGESLLMYKKLKMFVHGDSDDSETQSQVRLSMRLGRGDMTEYYEVTTDIYPEWDERNHIEMIFKEITRLKMMAEEEFSSSDEYFYLENGFVREYRPMENDEYNGKVYRVVGDPSLSRVEKLQIGVTNTDEFNNYTGEIWVNEMRVTETNNDPGLAMRGSFNFNLGGLMTFNANAQSKDANFHQVNQQTTTSQNNSQYYALNMTINADKVLPDKWRVDLPIVLSQKDDRTIPKYYPGSDIILEDDLNDSLKTLSMTRSVSTSYKRNGTSEDNVLLKYLVNPVKASYVASRTDYSSLEILERFKTRQKASISYGLRLNKGNGIKLFSWIPFAGKNFRDLSFYYIPESFSWSMNLNEKEEDKVTRTTRDTTSSYDFLMNKKMSLTYQPFKSMEWKYARQSSSDMGNFRDDKWRVFEELEYDSLMNGFNVGNVSNISEKVTLRFDPKITAWLHPNISYGSDYSYKTLTSWGYAKVSNSRTIKGSVSLSPVKIWQSAEETVEKLTEKSRERKKEELLRQLKEKQQPSISKEEAENRKKPVPPPRKDSSPASARPPRKRRPGSQNNQLDQKKSGQSKKINVSDILKRINPISISYNNSRSRGSNGVMGLDSAKIYKDVSYVYRYGLGGGTYLPVEQYNDALSTPISNKTNEVISARSGIKITNNISVSFDYKQSMNTGKSYQFKTTGGDYYDDINDIIADGDTLTLLPYDSSLTRSYLPLGQVGKDGFPFPSYSLTWRFNPRQVKWLKDRIAFIQSINFQHRMSASEKLSYQYNDDPSIAAVQERYSNYSLNFSPLVKARIKFKGNLSTDIGYNKTIKTDNEGDVINNFTNTSVTRTFSDDITMSLSYSYNKGIIIPVPFLKVKKLNLDNNITFSMSGKYGKSKKEVKQIGSTEFNDPRINKTNWEISPQLSYKFSKNIEGQLFFKYGQQVDKTQMGEDGKFKTSDYKDFGLTVKIRISG